MAPASVATGCGDDDEKRAMDAEDGGASPGGAAGEAGASGSSVDPGAAGLAGDATQPGSGGHAGAADVDGGASPGGADSAAAGAAGNGAIVRACSYSNGSACDEISGTLESAIMFQQECSSNERISLDACPTANLAGQCTYEQEEATLLTNYYAPIDAQELEAAEQACVDRSGEWVQP
jgi:hypothetical protein